MKKIAFVFPLLSLLLPVSALAQNAQVASNTEERLLNAHNIERARMGQSPLKWSEKLVADARSWAEYLARTDTFEHSEDHNEENPQGENLWMGTRAAYSPEKMVGAWIDERRLYRPGNFPNVSTTGKWIDVGHYTQLIWYNTTEVGCAIASNKRDDFLVCRYFPTGNWDEQNPQGHGEGKLAAASGH